MLSFNLFIIHILIFFLNKIKLKLKRVLLNLFDEISFILTQTAYAEKLFPY